MLDWPTSWLGLAWLGLAWSANESSPASLSASASSLPSLTLTVHSFVTLSLSFHLPPLNPPRCCPHLNNVWPKFKFCARARALLANNRKALVRRTKAQLKSQQLLLFFFHFFSPPPPPRLLFSSTSTFIIFNFRSALYTLFYFIYCCYCLNAIFLRVKSCQNHLLRLLKYTRICALNYPTIYLISGSPNWKLRSFVLDFNASSSSSSRWPTNCFHVSREFLIKCVNKLGKQMTQRGDQVSLSDCLHRKFVWLVVNKITINNLYAVFVERDINMYLCVEAGFKNLPATSYNMW